jgi:1-acyl-sn-glycerol-3-phosphate acyltransferase
MHNIIIEEPYQFIPPHESRFWRPLMLRYIPRHLRRCHGITQIECRGLEHLQRSIDAGHGVLLTPNHSRPADPMTLGVLSQQAHAPLFIMASWHVFKQDWLQTFVVRHMGAFSVYREGMDKAAVSTAIDILSQARRPLTIFPEGVITRSNDRLLNMMEGTSFIARAAAKKRAKTDEGGKVVVHPVAMKYLYRGDIHETVDAVLNTIEQRLSWRSQNDLSNIERLRKVGAALLSLKETEYMGRPQNGELEERLAGLIDHLLVPLEDEWLEGRREDDTVMRVKNLRTAVLRDMVAGEVDESERDRRWRQLADMYLAQQLSFYSPGYIRDFPSADRYLETVDRFEEDLTDKTRVHRPVEVVIQVGEPIEVSPKRDRSADGDPLMNTIREQLQGMLDELSHESTMA